MSIKALVGLMALITLLAFPCQGEYSTVSISHYKVSLDFGDKNVTTEQMPTVSDINSIRRAVSFHGDSAADWGTIYLFNYREGTGMVMEEMLRQLMMPSCKAIRINGGNIGGMGGLIATADARVEHGFGQRCYGGIMELTPMGTGETNIFAVIGHFTNESLNKPFVKNARIVYSDDSIKI